MIPLEGSSRGQAAPGAANERIPLMTPRPHSILRFLTPALLSILLLFTPYASSSSPDPQISRDGFHPAMLKDISDRAYEPAVIALLSSAKDSIILSMYYITPQKQGPVRSLIRDLENALDRGVSVEIYMNTRFKPGQTTAVAAEEAFDILRKKGARIYAVTPVHLLHHKLIDVDYRHGTSAGGPIPVIDVVWHYHIATSK